MPTQLGPILDLWWNSAVPVLTCPLALLGYGVAAGSLALVRITRNVPLLGPAVRSLAFFGLLPACLLLSLAWYTLGLARLWQARMARLAAWSYGVAAWTIRADHTPLIVVVLGELALTFAHELRTRYFRQSRV